MALAFAQATPVPGWDLPFSPDECIAVTWMHPTPRRTVELRMYGPGKSRWLARVWSPGTFYVHKTQQWPWSHIEVTDLDTRNATPVVVGVPVTIPCTVVVRCIE